MGTYNEVVIAAADEAGGQGFVTEMADDSTTLDQVVVRDFERQEWARIQNQTYADPLDLLDEVSSYFNGWDGIEDALRTAVTLPMDVTLEDFLGCPRCYADDPGVVVNENRLLTELYEKVVKPMFDTDDLLLSRPYVTRLYTTMSADEMTMDPSFDVNSDLADVSNVHTAEQLIKCDGTWEITLPQGGVVHGDQQGVWPDLGDQPANFEILQLSTRGQGETIEDNEERIKKLLEAAAPEPASGGSGGVGGARGGGEDGGTVFEEADGGVRARAVDGNVCGCRVPGASAGRPLAALAWLGLALLVSRRRRSRGGRP
jgi:MYXO-CTERM domain-containing protein